jgi:hypothetical protein
MTDEVRKSISATLTEIEKTEKALDLPNVLPSDDFFGADPDASEALEILKRIERKLFPAGMPN